VALGWRAAAVAVALLWLAIILMAWRVTAQAGESGVVIQHSSFAPRSVAPGQVGVPIVAVTSGTPAFRAGIRAGDTLLAVNGVPAEDSARLSDEFFRLRAGEVTTLRVQPRLPDAAGAGAPTGPVRDVPLALESRLDQPAARSVLVTYGAAGLMTLIVVVPLALARPNERPARVLLVAGGAGAIWQAVDAWYGGLRDRWLPLAWDPVDQVGYVIALANAVGILHFFLIFPAPLAPARWLDALGPAAVRSWRGAMGLLYLGPIGLALALFAQRQSPVALLWTVVAVVLGLAIVALGASYARPATPLARAQLRWIFAGMCVVGILLAGGPLVQIASGGRIVLISWATTVTGWGLFYLALALAIVRYRLLDTGSVLRTALLVPLLGGAMLLVYALADLAIGSVVAQVFGRLTEDDLRHVLAALVAAASFNPARHRLSAALDAAIHHEGRRVRGYATAAVEALSRAQPAGDVLRLLTDDAARAMGLQGAWVVREPGMVEGVQGDVPPSLVVAGVALLARLEDVSSPVLLADSPLRQPGLATLTPDNPDLAAWHAMGVRLVVPLRVPADGHSGMVGLWLLGAGHDWLLPERDDLAALRRVARQAAVLLDYARLHEAHLAAQLASQRHLMEQERLRTMERLKDEFTSMVSHELRTPIGIVKGFGTTLLRSGAAMSEAERRQSLRLIVEASDQLMALVNNLLDMSLISAGRFAVSPRPGGVDTILHGVARRLRATHATHKILVDVPPNLPRAHVDPPRLEQVLANLIDNAVKYSPDGSTVRLSAERRGEELLVSVADEGDGIPPSELGQLFDRYRRGRSARARSVGGSGLGLAICRHLVEAHGGRIWAESPVPGRAAGAPPGAALRFTLPLTPRLPADEHDMLDDGFLPGESERHRGEPDQPNQPGQLVGTGARHAMDEGVGVGVIRQ
jgi:signal transduction histidine kinase